jgi:hypothetical protein
VLVQAPIVTMKIASVKGRKVDDLILRIDGSHSKTSREAISKKSETEDGEETPSTTSAPRTKGDDRKRGTGLAAACGDRLPGWTLRREYRSTYRGKLEGTERLVSGKFTGRVRPAKPSCRFRSRRVSSRTWA